MSCRRSDRTRLVGCKIGDTLMNGCSRGCCPYPDSEIAQNTRPYLLDQHYPISHNVPLQYAEGRTGLYYLQCMSSYRPKFFCPEPKCRRSIKPVYDPDRFEYKISEFQEWSVRPLAKFSPGIEEAYRNCHRMWSMRRRNQETEEIVTCRRLNWKYCEDPSSISQEDYEFLRARSPEMWWRKVIARPQVPGEPGVNMVRCPSCGKSALPVGSNFRIPKKKDKKAWKEIWAMIYRGEDMVAKFSFCATTEEHEKMVKRALEVRGKDVQGGLADWRTS